MSWADPSPTPKPGDTGEPSNSWIPGLGGAIFGGLAGYAGQREANETNIQLGREQMKFQERMSNSAYQRAVDDMKKAGINPMLVTQVGGANTPSGAMPQVQNAIGAGVSSAGQAVQTMQEVQRMQQTAATTQQIKATTDKIVSETMDKNINTAFRLAETEKTKRDAALKATQELHEAEQGKIAEQRRIEGKFHGGFAGEAKEKAARGELTQLDVNRAKAESEFWETGLGKDMPQVRAILEMVRGLSGALGTIGRVRP